MKTIRLTGGYLWPVVALGFITFPVSQSDAQSTTLSARDTSLQINVDGGAGGLSNWMIDGVNQLQSQWFYYSIGASPVSAINSIAPWTPPTLQGVGGNSPILSETYANANSSLTTKYTLNSGQVGSHTASLGIALTFQNLTGASEVVNLFQYANFGLAGGTTGQVVNFPGTGFPYTVNQAAPSGTTLHGTLSLNGGTVGLVAGLFDGTDFGLLGGSANFNSTTLSAGPGNVNFGYEFSATLAPNASITVSELLAVVPEPSSVALMAFGTLALAVYSRRRLARGTGKAPEKS